MGLAGLDLTMGAICLDEELGEMGGALLGKWFACGPCTGWGKVLPWYWGCVAPPGIPCLAW